jgi:hypothetical protein
MAYGMVMGSFGGFDSDRLRQILFSAAKLPLLLCGTFLLCVPSFFVLNTLAGLRSDFAQALQALLAAQAGTTIVLCSFAPFTVVWYVSFADYHAAILFNALVFGISTVAAQIVLRRLYQPLIARSRKHALLLRIWLVLYAFVGMQLAWVLRPFVGQPNTAVQFLRPDAWGNAYLEILHHLSSLF